MSITHWQLNITSKGENHHENDFMRIIAKGTKKEVKR
jgi:hypothetical protein